MNEENFVLYDSGKRCYAMMTTTKNKKTTYSNILFSESYKLTFKFPIWELPFFFTYSEKVQQGGETQNNITKNENHNPINDKISFISNCVIFVTNIPQYLELYHVLYSRAWGQG